MLANVREKESMFTGIVAAVGRIEKVDPFVKGEFSGVRLTVEAGGLDLEDVILGDSIAIQGACMTAVSLDGNRFQVDVSYESLQKTVGLDRPGEVNLEKALRVGDRLGGHIVSGHVDGVGRVIRLEPVGESHELVIEAPHELAQYLAYKGSVAVNGVSLTINRVSDLPSGCQISINLIPHTLVHTTFHLLKAGDGVNLEIDTVARYVARMNEVAPKQ